MTGAFLPEALRFTELRAGEGWTSTFRQFDNTASKRARRKDVESTLRSQPQPLDLLAFFCHGFRKGLQTGHNTWNVKALVNVIAETSWNDVRIALFACDTGRDNDNDRKDDNRPGPGGESGFADKLRDHLVDLGMSGGWIDAHTVAGHTTKAPYVHHFYINEQAKDLGDDWLVTPGSPEWRAWRNKLQNDAKFRLSFPLMSQSEIYEAL